MHGRRKSANGREKSLALATERLAQMKFRCHGLLHLCENQRTAMNVSVKDFKDQISVYTNNAILLSKSLRAQNIDFTLLTNDPATIKTCSPSAADVLEIKTIPFTTDVPQGVIFYSAHYKLDALRHLSTLNEEYTALCDLDMLCINEFPQCLKNIIANRTPLCYDISDQVIPAYGHAAIIEDLESIHKIQSEGRWSGGEFISGSPGFFARLARECEKVYPNYIANLDCAHHVGDEAFISAALELLRREQVYIADAGTLGIVGRYWNTSTLHSQKPLEYFKQCFLLHLPADKRLLSNMVNLGIPQSQLKEVYARHCNTIGRTYWSRKLKTLAKQALNKLPLKRPF